MLRSANKEHRRLKKKSNISTDANHASGVTEEDVTSTNLSKDGLVAVLRGEGVVGVGPGALIAKVEIFLNRHLVQIACERE